MEKTFKIGTYNVENLFDRFDDPYSVGDDPWGMFRTSPKPRKELYEVGARIRNSSVDILGLQEVENIGALKEFVQGSVGPKFKPNKGIVSLPSNDFRGIDLGLLSALPIGRVTSHRFNEFKTPEKGKNVRFSRDCLQIEIYDRDRKEILVTVFLCHFKSKYSRYDKNKQPKKYDDEQKRSADKRQGEAEEVIRIVKSTISNLKEARFVILGDLNDTPNSAALAPLIATNNSLKLVNSTSLISQTEKSDEFNLRKPRPRDTYRWKRKDKMTGKTIYTCSQIDYILVSPALWKLSRSAKVMNNPIGGGSDHFLSWVEFDIPQGLDV